MSDQQNIAAEITRRLSRLAPDELGIMEMLLSRMEAGRAVYGPWHVDDKRNNPAEALAEVLDALHYCAAELVRLKRDTGVEL